MKLYIFNFMLQIAWGKINNYYVQSNIGQIIMVPRYREISIR